MGFCSTLHAGATSTHIDKTQTTKKEKERGREKKNFRRFNPTLQGEAAIPFFIKAFVICVKKVREPLLLSTGKAEDCACSAGCLLSFLNSNEGLYKESVNIARAIINIRK